VVRARELLEMERDALRLFTSCAWFFDDLGGLEPLQILRYGAHAIELAGADGARLEAGFGRRLSGAVSNDPEVGTAQRIYLEGARPAVPPAARVAASLAALRNLVPGVAADRRCGFDAAWEGDRLRLSGRRTGRTWSFDTSVEGSGGGLTARVTAPGAEPLTFAVKDLLERERDRVRAEVTVALASRALLPEETMALRGGAAGLPAVFEAAMVRAVRALATGGGPPAEAELTDLLDLFVLRGWPVPFDAQTDFWRWWSALPDEAARQHGPLARRLGFAAGES
jgi:hypothetical protein